MPQILARDIADAVQGELVGNPDQTIDSAAALDIASERQLSFFHNMKYLEALTRTNAGVVLVPPAVMDRLPEDKTWIRVNDPQWAFAVVLKMFDKDRERHPKGVHTHAEVDRSAEVHPTAAIGAFTVVEPGAMIGADAVIYSGCYIGARARIGEGALIYPRVVVREDTVIGARVVIHSGAVIGADGFGFTFHGGRHEKIPQIGNTVIEDDVEIGANVTIDRATTGDTRIGAGTKIDNLVHIAHNVHVGKNCLLVAFVGVSGSSKIGDGVTLAGQVGVAGHLKIGDGAVVMAQSGVMSDVGPGEMMFGSPARPRKLAFKLEALYGKLPEMYEAIKEFRRRVGI